MNSIQTAIIDLASLNSPHFTGNVVSNGTVSGITKAEVGLDQVDNTSDINKPVSTATQTALNAKQNALIRNHNATGIPVIDEYDNSVRHVFGVAPVQTALYFDPDIPGDLSNNQIQIPFDNTLSKRTIILQAFLMPSMPLSTIPRLLGLQTSMDL